MKALEKRLEIGEERQGAESLVIEMALALK